MKKILFLLLTITLLLVFVGCSSNEIKEETKSVEESKEVENVEEENVSNENIVKEDEDVLDEKLKDFDSIKEYLLKDEYFGLGYYEAQGEDFNYDNYQLNHLDFNGDNKLDTVIVTYTKENDYRVVVFITLENGEYKYYFTDLRAIKDSNFYYEDDFIIEEHSGYYQLALNIDTENAKFIKRLNASFTKDTIETDYKFNDDMKYKSVNIINEIDGYKEFETTLNEYFYDENGKEHLILNLKNEYKFNEKNMEFDYNEVISESFNLNEIMLDNFIIGNKSSLKTFNQIIESTDSLKLAIDYYLENRQEFDIDTRLNYTNDVFEYIDNFTMNYEMIVNEETSSNTTISNVSFWGDNPIPANSQELFKIVKTFFIEDGENFDYNMVFKYSDYRMTCIDEIYSNKIRMIAFDRNVLTGEYIGYISRNDEFVDIVFDVKENVYKKAIEIVYPTILINTFSEIKDLKHNSIWKANVIMIPENVDFIEYADDEVNNMGFFENETMYSRDQEIFVDYSNYNLVIIPMQSSVNEGMMENKTIEMTETGNETLSNFSVFGRLENVEITFTPNGMNDTIEPIVKNIGSVENTKIIVKAFMETDNATIRIKGEFYGYQGDFELIDFILDDMRDSTSYEIIMR
jgi:PBP1b-binding outer membrane lipoprotein LpoB